MNSQLGWRIQKTFGFSQEEPIGKTFKTIGLPIEIEDLIEDVFMTEQVREKQVRIDSGGFYSYMGVYGAPVIGTSWELARNCCCHATCISEACPARRSKKRFRCKS